MYHREVTLDDKYDLDDGKAFLTGIQALVRLPLDQKRLDLRQNLNTAGFISGYRGSPLGGYDQQLQALKPRLDAHDVTFWPGLNEDLGATAVWGSQQLGLYPGAQRDGVFGLWYGKAPGVDRTGDVFKHANMAGTSAHGGVVAVVGDDPASKSSTLPSQSEFALQDAEIPVLSPASIQDVLDYGLHAFAMSRFSGCWIGLTAVADTMDSGSVIEVGLDRFNFVRPDTELPPGGLHIRRNDDPLDKEHRHRTYKVPAAQAWARANKLDRMILSSPRPRIGIIVTGQAARDVFEALAALGVSPEQARDLGLSIYKVAMPWPLETSGVKAFCAGLERVVVVEHKRDLVETQLRAALYDLPYTQRPVIEGKRTVNGTRLLPDTGTISIPELAAALRLALPPGWNTDQAAAYFKRVGGGVISAENSQNIASRSPYYCSGCPHNTSTVVPEGSRALAGIGCHYMATFMPERSTDMASHMGGEGAAWIGQHFATDETHMFVNLGDGTYSHSGSLAIRAAVSAGVNMTYKILYNDAVAMTGGQSVDSGQTPQQIAQQVESEGVKTIVIVTEDPTRYAGVAGLPRTVRIFHRSELDQVQQDLRETEGVSVLIYDQVCATEKRRRIKRGLRAPDRVRVMINTEVCEGCGDCSLKSNCLSVEPVETDLGRKRHINQTSCNTDLSCLEGFCPSFVTITNPVSVVKEDPRPKINANGLPLPDLPDLTAPWNVILTGVGGTGVTTLSAVLAMAAHVDQQAATNLDMTGLAQKGGPVLSHVRFARTPEEIATGRVPPASADCIIGCDLVVAASDPALILADADRTTALVNGDVAPTSAFIHDRSQAFKAEPMIKQVEANTKSVSRIEAEALAIHYFNNSVFANMIMAGYAWQHGQLPVSLRGIFRAIKLNGIKVEDNMAAFDIGRIMAVDPKRLERPEDPRGDVKPMTLDELIEDRAQRLEKYQNEKYAQSYRIAVAKVRNASDTLSVDERLATAIAKYAYKVMAYKDEYEVARLWTDGTFDKTVAQHFKSGSLNLQLAPPLLAKKDRNGHLIKKSYGPWMLKLFKTLKKYKWLRGSFMDPFGWTADRKQERALRDRYLANIDRLLDELSQKNYELAIEIAEVPDAIRGYGHIKAAAIEEAEAREDALWAQWPAGTSPATKVTLIAAE